MVVVVVTSGDYGCYGGRCSGCSYQDGVVLEIVMGMIMVVVFVMVMGVVVVVLF